MSRTICETCSNVRRASGCRILTPAAVRLAVHTGKCAWENAVQIGAAEIAQERAQAKRAEYLAAKAKGKGRVTQ